MIVFPPGTEKDGKLTDLGICYLCNSSGNLDLVTVNRVLNKWYSRNQLQVFADNYFNQKVWEIPESSLTKDEFDLMYEFGKFEHGADWILYVYESSGKLLNRGDLFKWMQQ